MMPKTKEKIEEVYERCSKKFIKIDNSLYKEYQNMAYEDLDSALKEENNRWAISKAYQSLFSMCNSILVKKLGVYSKNHECVLIALAYNNLISKEILNKINELLRKENNPQFFEEISNIRMIRNNYLYMPKTLRKIKTPIKQAINEIRIIIKLLGEIE